MAARDGPVAMLLREYHADQPDDGVAVGEDADHVALVCLAGSLLSEQNGEWLVGRRYLSEESIAAVLARVGGAETVVEVSALPAA